MSLKRYYDEHSLEGFWHGVIESKVDKLKDVKIGVIIGRFNYFNQFKYINSLKKLKISEKLKKGFYSFDCPNNAKIGKSFQVRCTIAKKEKLLLKEQISSLNIEDINLGNIIKVNLNGEKFKIIELNSSTQFIIENMITSWKWLVTPNSSGNHKLRLSISIKLLSETSGEAFFDYEPHVKNIQVKLNIFYACKNFLLNNWQWIIAFSSGSGVIIKLIQYFMK